MLGALGIGAGIALANSIRHRAINHSEADTNADLRGQVVLITGGSRGLGLAMAQEFAKLGCKIAICARHDMELDAAREKLRGQGADVLAVRCDVSSRGDVEHLIREVRSRFGRIDILINNAGVIRVAPVQNMTLQDFEQSMGVMFWGVVYPTLMVLDEMKQRRSGRIVTIASIGGKVSIPHLLPYCSAKFAAVGFSEGLRAELAPHGVKVVTIAPGLMRTGSYRNAEFKGHQRAEAAWFSLSASLPSISMDATRAARQIVTAVRQGQSEKILSTQANLLARANGAFPGALPSILGLLNRFLPSGTDDRESTMTGADAERQSGEIVQFLMKLGKKAADKFNERPSSAQAEQPAPTRA